MKLKIYFLKSHNDCFPKNIGDYSEEQSELFHQDVKERERKYLGRRAANNSKLLADDT